MNNVNKIILSFRTSQNSYFKIHRIKTTKLVHFLISKYFTNVAKRKNKKQKNYIGLVKAKVTQAAKNKISTLLALI